MIFFRNVVKVKVVKNINSRVQKPPKNNLSSTLKYFDWSIWDKCGRGSVIGPYGTSVVGGQ